MRKLDSTKCDQEMGKAGRKNRLKFTKPMIGISVIFELNEKRSSDRESVPRLTGPRVQMMRRNKTDRDDGGAPLSTFQND